MTPDVAAEAIIVAAWGERLPRIRRTCATICRGRDSALAVLALATAQGHVFTSALDIHRARREVARARAGIHGKRIGPDLTELESFLRQSASVVYHTACIAREAEHLRLAITVPEAILTELVT